jgi:LPXTG-site transpeptidase (sortase) family protein
MKHHPYIERAAHVLAAVVLACGLLAGVPTLDALSRGPRATGRPAPAPAARINEGELVARIAVPRLSLDAPIYEGVGSRTLAAGAGHVPGTALPGEERTGGDSVIAVARDAGTAAVAELKVGERVQMRTRFGLKRYRVRERRILEPEHIRLGRSRGPRVTFVTPYPSDSIGPAPLRLAVVLEPAPETAVVAEAAPRPARLTRALLRVSARLAPRLRLALAAQAPMAWRNSETRPTGRTETSEKPDASEALPAGR